jgi:glycerophosphoryl diester phosphodiesterase
MDTVKINSKNARMIAHRGVSGLEVENTQLAFVAAGNRSYWGVETDVRTTADGHFIILHDQTTERVAGVALIPEECTLAQLRALTLREKDGSEGHPYLHLPTLEEYIRVCKKYEKHCVLELKSYFSEDELRRIIEIFAERDYLENTTFISFEYDNVVRMRNLLPDQSVQFLWGDFGDGLLDTLASMHIDIDIVAHILTKEIVDKIHAKGLKVNCWTVDSKEDAEKLAEWGVDFITTNILE